MAKTAGVERVAGAKIIAKDRPDEDVAAMLAALITDTVSKADRELSWSTLRVSCETASVDPEFWQLRVGVHKS